MVWNLSEKPQDFWGMDVKEGDLALELEVEGYDLPSIKTKMWTSHNDGSLKIGGVEYVHNGPKGKDEVYGSLKNWVERITKSGARIIKSERTSVHVHKNMQKYDLRQIMQGVVAYYMLEPALMKHCGRSRKGNLFCLPMEDGKLVVDAIQRFAKGDVNSLNMDQYRYASLNLGALKKFGSLEVRTMRGQYEADFLNQWAQNINGLFEKAAENFKSPTEVLDYFYGRSYKDYLGTFLSSDFVDTLVRYDGWNEKPDRNHVALASVCYDNDWERADVKRDYTPKGNNSLSNYTLRVPTPREEVRRPQWSDWEEYTPQLQTENTPYVEAMKAEVEHRLATWYEGVWTRFVEGRPEAPEVRIRELISELYTSDRWFYRRNLQTGNIQTRHEVYMERGDEWVEWTSASLTAANLLEEEWRLYAIPRGE